MERTTRARVEGALKTLIATIAQVDPSAHVADVSTVVTDAGGYGLDYNSAYGGYLVYLNLPSGGETHPFGGSRRSAQEMWYTLHFATCVAEIVVAAATHRHVAACVVQA